MNKQTIKQSWELIDKAIFGSTNPKDVLKENYKDYCIIKSALLTEIFEMYKVVFPSDKWEDFYTNDIPSIIKKAKKITESAINKSSIKQSVKQKVLQEIINSEKEKDINKLIKEHITKTTLSLLIDSILMTPAIEKSENWEELINSAELDIIKGSYNLFKEELIDLVIDSIASSC